MTDQAGPSAGKAGANTYREHEINTASPARLVAMLYEGAIRALRQAIQAIEAGEIERRWSANARASDIIEHLLLTLDAERGGQIAADLERLYKFMMRQIVNVDLNNDPAPARAVIALLEPLHRSWCKLDDRRAVDVPRTPDRRGEMAAPVTATGYGSDKQVLAATPGSRVFSTA